MFIQNEKINHNKLYFYLLFCWLCHVACKMLVLQPEIELGLWQ